MAEIDFENEDAETDDDEKSVAYENVSVYISSLKKEYSYFMTNDFDLLVRKLNSLGYVAPVAQNWRWNPSLVPEVRAKMAKLGTQYSLLIYENIKCLNHFKENSEPFIIYLNEIKIRAKYPAEEINSKRIEKKLNNIKTKKWPALMYAVNHNSPELVKFLISHGENVNFQDSNGFSPLLVAVVNNNQEIVKILIDAGADVNLMTARGMHILAFAILEDENDSYTQIIKMLSDAGADVSKLSLNSKTPNGKLSFPETLNFFISQVTYNGMKNSNFIYKNTQINGSGGLSKQTFSKIRSNTNPNYRPEKKNI